MKTATEICIEARILELLKERRAKGRKTYSKGLDYTDDYDWLEMAIEETVDALQYLLAEKLKRGER